MKIITTGGAGFIGSHLVEALLQRGDTVEVIDDFNDFYNPEIKRQNIAGFKSDVRLHEIDICDKEAVHRVIREGKPDAIVHLAARAGVRPSVQHPELYLQTNVMGTFHLLEAARLNGVPRFVFASSSSVYGATTELPFREDQPLVQTLSPYAGTKLAGEHLCSNYSHLHGIRAVCLRFFTVYGPRQRPDLSIHKFTDLIYRERPIEVYGDGTARRDFTYIDDIQSGILGAINYAGADFDVFNLGESDTVELRGMIRLVEKALGKTARIEYRPPVPGDMPQTYADITKARNLLGYRPTTKIEDGIPKFVDWYLATKKP
jgi:UDP-glucuronate 4-epimerase